MLTVDLQQLLFAGYIGVVRSIRASLALQRKEGQDARDAKDTCKPLYLFIPVVPSLRIAICTVYDLLVTLTFGLLELECKSHVIFHVCKKLPVHIEDICCRGSVGCLTYGLGML
jgi:hypothetical protein